MNILLVDDRPAEAQRILTLLHGLGHSVDHTPNGNEALALLRRQGHDIVITRPCNEGLDGFALTREALALAAPRWQPVIFLALPGEAGLQADALEAGADLFLVEPFSESVLTARLAAFGRLVGMQRENDRRRGVIDRYVAAEEEDLRIARHLIEYQMATRGDGRLIDDPDVSSWQRPCRRIGGDMLLGARSPSGMLHVLLADARGSGLSAYVSLQPIIAPFQRMTDKGFKLAAIARELNCKVRQTLPHDRQVSVLLAAIDGRSGVVTVWNGGMPAAFMLDAEGHHFHEFSLMHPALGALAEEDFDESVDLHAFAAAGQLVMFSDGVLEATGPNGGRFGERGIAEALVGPETPRRAEGLVCALETHLAGGDPGDDMTFALIDCRPGAGEKALPGIVAKYDERHGDWGFSLRLAGHELRHVDVVPLLLGVTEQFPAARRYSGELFVILSELFNNALDHGLLQLDSQIKHSPEGLESWLAARAKRLESLSEGEIQLDVEQVTDRGLRCLRIRCTDSGDGFELADKLQEARQRMNGSDPCTLPYGRGLALVGSMANIVDTGPRGNAITVLLPLEGSEATR